MGAGFLCERETAGAGSLFSPVPAGRQSFHWQFHHHAAGHIDGFHAEEHCR